MGKNKFHHQITSLFYCVQLTSSYAQEVDLNNHVKTFTLFFPLQVHSRTFVSLSLLQNFVTSNYLVIFVSSSNFV